MKNSKLLSELYVPVLLGALLILVFIIFGGFTPERIESPFIVKTYKDYSAQQNKLDSTGGIKTDVDKNWYESVMNNLRKEEYYIGYDYYSLFWQSPNRANNMRFAYAENWFSVKPRLTRIPLFDESDINIKKEDKKYSKVPEWNLKIKTNGFRKGTNGIITSFSGTDFMTEKNKGWIEDDNMRIDYLNDENGMRQDFKIKNKPAGKGFLRVEMAAETDLKMLSGADVLLFKNTDGSEALQYGSLKAWDANGKDLKIWFENRNNKSKEFSIVVNDDDAEYPVIIDPVSGTKWAKLGDQASAEL